MIRTSKLASCIKPSLIRRFFNLAKSMTDVIDFTLGDPDVQPHDNIKQAACEAINSGKTRYSQNVGLLELRQAISNYCSIKEQLEYDPTTEIAVTVGAMEGLYLTFLAILDCGDEVIIPAPYYINYKQMSQLCQATPVIVEPSQGSGLSIQASAIERAITPKTKAIVLNTPSNPSGQLIDTHELEAIAELAIKHDLVVVADEVYKTLIYDGAEFKSIVKFNGMRERTIIINSLSKEYCMTGYRVGYVNAPKEVIETIVKLQENVAACAPLPSQYAAIEALSSFGEYSQPMIEIFTKRRNILVEGLSKIEKISFKVPNATFYILIDVTQTGMSSEEFAYALLEQQRVAVIPGIAYGECCKNHVRLAFTLDEQKIAEGVKRIDNFIKSLK